MLRLRPYKKCDAKHIVGWIKGEYSFMQWSAGRYKKYPITADDMNDYYAQYDNNDSFFAMTAFDEDAVVGHHIMRFTDEEKNTVRFGFIIVDSSKRGMGYGKKMLTLSLKYAFEILGAKKVTLGVFANNDAAYRCYKAVGFTQSETAENELYQINGESWECIELEFQNPAR